MSAADDGDERYDDDFEVEDTAAAAATGSSGSELRAIAPADVDLGAQLGGGGFAVVYAGRMRAADGRSGDQLVAVKALVDSGAAGGGEEAASAFAAELSAMAALPRHPNIVRLLGAHTKPPRQWMVMERCGASLFDVLHGGGGGAAAATRGAVTVGSGRSLPLARRLQLALDAARAVACLHGLKPSAMIHRDIKPANLLLSLDAPAGAECNGARLAAATSTAASASAGGVLGCSVAACGLGGGGATSAVACSGHVKLCDFGLVGSRSADAGTPAYMAPELLRCVVVSLGDGRLRCCFPLLA